MPRYNSIETTIVYQRAPDYNVCGVTDDADTDDNFGKGDDHEEHCSL